MLSLTKKPIVMSLAIGLNIFGCTNSNQVDRGKLQKQSKIAEKVEKISIDPQSLNYLYRGDDLSISPSTKDSQHEQVIDLYTRAIEADSQNTCAYERRADSYKNIKQYDKAVADLTKGIAVDSHNISAYVKRAAIYYLYLDEGNKAIADMNKAISLTIQGRSESPDLFEHSIFCQPGDLDSLYKKRTLIFLALEQFDRAIDDADRVVAISSLANDYHFRAFVYREAKQYENAIANENIAIAAHPSYAHAYNGRADSYGQLEQYKRAIADYTKAISLYSEQSNFNSNNVDYADAYLGRANIYRELKQYDRAIADYDKSLAVYPEFAYAYKHRGEFYQELGNVSQAKQDLSQAANLFKEQENIEEYQIVQQQLQQL